MLSSFAIGVMVETINHAGKAPGEEMIRVTTNCQPEVI